MKNNYFYYSRCSTINQSVSRQLVTFRNHGHVTETNVYIDKVQGNIPFLQRPDAIRLFNDITSIVGKKTLVIDSIDRLGRNLSNILATIEVFTNNGINIESIKEGFNTLLPDGKVNPLASLLIGILGSISEMERLKIKERTNEGIAIAKSNGKYKGRKIGSLQSDEKTLIRHAEVVSKLKKGISIRDVHEITGKATSTINQVRKILTKRGEI
jgi:DNA invertase Pin-like site-specific DNA recombinase